MNRLDITVQSFNQSEAYFLKVEPERISVSLFYFISNSFYITIINFQYFYNGIISFFYKPKLVANDGVAVLRGLETLSQIVIGSTNGILIVHSYYYYVLLKCTFVGYRIENVPVQIYDKPAFGVTSSLFPLFLGINRSVVQGIASRYWKAIFLCYKHQVLYIFICIPTKLNNYYRKIIDVLMQLKMNGLHWHLTDNEGFSLGSSSHPEFNSPSSPEAKQAFKVFTSS